MMRFLLLACGIFSYGVCRLCIYHFYFLPSYSALASNSLPRRMAETQQNMLAQFWHVISQQCFERACWHKV
jgi:hypothetical protein